MPCAVVSGADSPCAVGPAQQWEGHGQAKFWMTCPAVRTLPKKRKQEGGAGVPRRGARAAVAADRWAALTRFT